MKMLLLICWLSMLAAGARAQEPSGDRVLAAVRDHPQADTGRVNRLLALAEREKTTKRSFAAYQEALSLARQIKYASGEAHALLGLGFYYRFRNDYARAFRYTKQAQQQFRQLGDKLSQIWCLYNLSFTVYGQGQFAQAMTYSLEGLNLAEELHSQKWLTLIHSQLGIACITVGEYAQARHYLLRGLRLAQQAGDQEGAAFCIDGLGRLAALQGKWAEALRYHDQQVVLAQAAGNQRLATLGQMRSAEMSERLGHYQQVFAVSFRTLQRLRKLDDVGNIPYMQIILARAYLHTNRPDSALVYGRASLLAGQRSGTKMVIREASDVLAQASARLGRFADAYRYQLLFTAYKDSLSNQDLRRRTAALQYNHELDKQQSQIRLLTRNQQLSRQRAEQQRLLLVGSLVALAAVAGLSVLLWRNNQEKQRTNVRLQKQKRALKATQAQLVQREKMASLGELTAGIAHEIQNPLNFVTNFSELSAELVSELADAQQQIPRDEALETELLADLKQNLYKISQHGSRAASIVKGMAEHARPFAGERQPTDLNAVAEEHLRLAYHSQRAKHKDFNVTLATRFAKELEPIEAVPQEIGRVLLNLYANAFYAVHQKAAKMGPEYHPEVTVSTQRAGSNVELRVHDNGVGMPPEVIEKAFQPFFTTKPAGQGTGLGLSLSYDIITKGYGGTLTVESRESEYTEVVLTLPITSTSLWDKTNEAWEESAV
ncbi:ATP-binding protein [Hymenobacter sp. BT491]|uniref:ATP-binding protein n=1 Tax=Hymenobacter sp. BT491 TaxID=2766779 RepID=UPI001653BF67|nr:ATP-binding protein [Hymenobacter sp. BT491]MBC6989566.1 tetratricopeptide repeat protein [Hymenobacter sp. BT491]